MAVVGSDRKRINRRGRKTKAATGEHKFVSRTYVVSDGEMVLHLETDETGGYVVTCPFDPGITTQAETIEEAFEMARDAAELLREVRQELNQGVSPVPRRTRGVSK